MPKTFRLPHEKPLLDIASYARGGPDARDRLTPAQVDHIRRTVRRVPEVMVKVLARNSSDFKAAKRHLDYIGRYGDLELEGNDGERWQGRVGEEILKNWSLHLDEQNPTRRDTGGAQDRKLKLVHKLMFSMPPGTSPGKVLSAVRNFAREEFGLKHRYAFVLHTDEPHLHVHLLLKAISEKGARLNIEKATLRHWRSEFALQLGRSGVEANATERAVRGKSCSSRRDGIYRANLRGQSTFVRAQVEASKPAGREAQASAESGRRALLVTRHAVTEGWRRASAILLHNGYEQLAIESQRFLEVL